MAKRITLIGGQFGDEGKGARTTHYINQALDLSSDEGVLVYRWQGSTNAGHTVALNGEVFDLHGLPSGVVMPRTYNFMDEGMFVNPLKIVKEIEGLRERSVKVSPENLGIASNAHVTLSYHTEADRENFEKANHTATGNGVMQTAIDLMGRVGIRFAEFLDKDSFEGILSVKFPEGVCVGNDVLGVKEFSDSYTYQRDFLNDFMRLRTGVFRDFKDKYQIGEGAQGFALDVAKGLYPGVTSSNPAVNPNPSDANIGVFKLYCSSVGSNRPFVSRMNENLENTLREFWGERGVTTGRPRTLGWFDAVAAKHAVDDANIEYLVVNCGDRLDALVNLGEKPNIVVAYEIDGKKFDRWDTSFHNRNTLYRAKPVFETFEPWRKFTDSDGELTTPAQAYVNAIEELLGKEIVLIGTGPGTHEVHEMKSLSEL